MSDERNDDEILGRALSRAIETQDAEETPYERSRVAVHPLRRGLPVWQMLGAAAVLVLAVAFGAWLTRPDDTLPVAASATPTPSASSSSAITSAPQSAAPQYTPVWAYFTRDGLPPIGAMVNAHVGVIPASADARISQRLMALAMDVRQSDLPAGTVDPLAVVAGATSGSGGGIGIAVRVDGDLATLDFHLVSGWAVHGTSMAQQLVQQIVYTATEEAGIRRVLILEGGKTSATIDQLVVSKPLSRDDVLGYSTLASLGTTTFPLQDRPGTAIGAALISREIQDGTLLRFTFEGRDRAKNDAKADLPTTKVTFARNDGTVPHNLADGPRPAYVLTIGFQWNSTFSSGGVGHVERIDRSPLRLVAGDSNTFYELGLDDARPWRAYMPDTQHLVVEIGGDPRIVSDRIALADSPSVRPGGTVGRAFTLAGSARTFEANVVWRLKDASGRIVANDHTTASIGTSALWGTFSTQATLPSSASGNVTLEVYEVSAKDGSEQGMVSVPLVVR